MTKHEVYHVYPVDDVFPHVVDGPDAWRGRCWCQPQIEYVGDRGMIVVHRDWAQCALRMAAQGEGALVAGVMGMD